MFAATEIKAKWKNLRDKYRQELKRLEERTRSGAAAVEESTWRHFNAMCFLREQFTPRATIGNIVEEVEVKVDQQLADVDCTFLNESTCELYQLANDPAPENSPPPKRMRSKDNIANRMLAIEEAKLAIIAKEQEPQDELMSFFGSLAKQMQSLSQQQKMECMIDMQKIVYNKLFK